ncbi:MAG: nickel-dependent hydrogenase large subunit [Chloroflexota bacterium]|nr:nickel-dependent hydrogenase large subunit [Chloroflexota bacterium]
MAQIIVDPLTRIEGHLKVDVTVDGGVVTDARIGGMLWRGIEVILKDRDPRDAVTITQRICGVCPTAHALASTLCLDDAFGVATIVPDNGRIIRNLIMGANYLQSHILHFYHLTALDYVDVAAVATYDGASESLNAVKDFIGRGELGPFVPRYEGDYRLSAEQNQAAVEHYVQALDMRRISHELSAIYSGIMPHQKAVLPGGVTAVPTADNIAAFLWKLNQIRHFIDNVYIPDVLMVAGAYPDYFAIGKGCGNYMSYGVFDLQSGQSDPITRDRLLKQGRISEDLDLISLDIRRITEDVTHSWYSSNSGLHPSVGETEPDPQKAGAYSWLKSPRYEGIVYEVGPLSRMLVSYGAGEPTVQTLVNNTLTALGADATALFSVLGRHAARALEAKFIADKMAEWVLELNPNEPVYAEASVPGQSTGAGIWEGPRGSLGHWINIEGGKIKNYQCVVPTTWNCSPMDDQGKHGPTEQALIGTTIQDEENPFEIGRIVRSFDPCIACAVHMLTPKGRELKRFRVV